MAEVCWGALADRQDGLRLLALAVQGLGAKGLEDYEPPSATLAEALGQRPEPVALPLSRGEERAQQVAAFISMVGGEAG